MDYEAEPIYRRAEPPIARREGGGVRLITRKGHDFSKRYPAVASAVGRLRCRSCIIVVRW